MTRRRLSITRCRARADGGTSVPLTACSRPKSRGTAERAQRETEREHGESAWTRTHQRVSLASTQGAARRRVRLTGAVVFSRAGETC